ncbi:MAG: phosphotriesterase-related protein [Armatimonadota bacterium]|nr:phosphotriesterase-related protein [Armatimonadota bacterium]MDR7422769.1 phosphotriesterase-related protein [Armatimonadota bacterium]MDR7454790.1 phosphotriesterase-related protein [Armatimonadota bacterium]MDR7495410.1 phosphotriesterase-related protein [Armatimonadota bacterium]
MQTVRGPVAPEALGPTLMHEHVLCDFYRVTGHLDQILNDEGLAAEELLAYRRAGGAALVEVTTRDLGSNPAGLRRVSEQTGLHIVAATGWYRQPYYPPEIDRTPVNRLADLMVKDLTEGIGESGVRAGIIGEIGAHLDYLTAQEERVLRAAARAQRATGAPLTTHASMYPVGLAQLEVLREENVDLARVIVGHCDTYLDPAYHRAVLRTGAYVQFDTIGRRHMNPDGRRADALVALVRDGWQRQLLLSSDRCYRSDLHAFGGAGYDVVITEFRALVRDRGMADDAWEAMLVDNPRRILAW